MSDLPVIVNILIGEWIAVGIIVCVGIGTYIGRGK